MAVRIGAGEAIAEALPQQEVDLVHRLQQQGATVAMIGDGINYAPSLAQADLWVAPGPGTDISMKAAHIVITNWRLDPILEAFERAAQTVRTVRQNLFWAFFHNTVGIRLAGAGVLHSIFAAAAMVVSSLTVIWYAVRLGRRHPRSVTDLSRNLTLAFRI